ncbi:MAG: ABC transporter permease [Oscillospiraceae bacterium]|nr:ABC transporter permease [Oscillospiraceae bacterium]
MSIAASKERVLTPAQIQRQRKFEQTADTFRRVFKTPSSKLGGIIFLLIVLISIFAPLIAPYDPSAMDFNQIYQSPSLQHLCGTDKYGRDIFSRLMYGGRYSLTLGLVADVMGHALGIILGSLAGYFGSRVEMGIMRFCDIWQSIPAMLMTILLSSIFGTGFWQTIFAISIGTIPSTARIIRGQMLVEKGKEYLEAAQSINCSSAKIMFSHLLPNTISPIIVSMTMGIGSTITQAAGLSYLGLGVPMGTPEWGSMLSEGTSVIQTYPHVILFPGLTIGLCVLAVNLMGDGIRDALDPKLRK